jgi:hypothetical protein
MAYKVRMKIPATRAGLFAQMFQDEGLEVTRIEEGSGGADENRYIDLSVPIVQVVYFLKDNAASGVVGGASFAAAQTAVKKIREKFPKAKIGEIEEDSSDI